MSMSKVKAVFAAALVMTCAEKAMADQQCTSKMTGFNPCEAAHKLASILAPELPKKVNSAGEVTTVVAVGNTLRLGMTLPITQEQLNAGLQNGGSLKRMKGNLRRNLYNGNCAPNAPTYQYINAGLRIIYSYSLMDGTYLTEVTVDRCS